MRDSLAMAGNRILYGTRNGWVVKWKSYHYGLLFGRIFLTAYKWRSGYCRYSKRTDINREMNTWGNIWSFNVLVVDFQSYIRSGMFPLYIFTIRHSFQSWKNAATTKNGLLSKSDDLAPWLMRSNAYWRETKAHKNVKKSARKAND
jgi:hypothetical protein